MKVFLSHPMHGIPESEVMELRADMQKVLSVLYNEEIELIDNYHHEDVPDNAGRLWHLGTSIRMMEQADAVFFVDGWDNARGCHVEYEICRYYNLRVLNDEMVEYHKELKTGDGIDNPAINMAD